jgi:hypothetical protein
MLLMKSALGMSAALMAASALTPAQAALTVSAAATQNVTCASGTCTATAAAAVLNVKSLANLLRKGDVSVVSGNVANDIVIAAPLHWTSAQTLTLDASRNIAINRAVQVTGEGGLVLQGGAGAFLNFAWNGYVNFLSTSSHLNVAGHDYTLVSSLPSLIAAVNSSPVGYFALANSYDASVDGVYTSSPMPLTLLGGLEGLGNKIDGVHMNNEGIADVTGLIDIVGLGATVDNMRLTHVAFKAGNMHGLVANVGGIAGTNLGTISNSAVQGSVQGWNATLAGGVAGLNAGNIVRSSTTGAVSGEDAGGIVGQNTGTVNDCFSSAKIRSVGSLTGLLAGGLVGGNLLGNVTSSFATGTVSGVQGSTLGGAVGNNTGNLTNVYAKGTVAGGTLSMAGGLAGSNIGAISQSYSTGGVTVGSLGTRGGFVGTDLSLLGISSSYWDTTTSGITSPGAGNQLLGEAGITGLSNTQLTSGVPSGFSTTVWSQNGSINSGLPYLLEMPPA